MKIFYSQKDDIDKVYGLWQECFNDPVGFADYYFTEKIKGNKILLLEEDNHLISMAHLNPYTINIQGYAEETVYIIGVATHEEYRRKGYMRQIMNRLLMDVYNQGKSFVYLVPANYKLYKDFGFQYINEQYIYEISFKECENILIKEYTYEIVNIQNEKYFVQISWLYNKMAEKYDLHVIKDVEYYKRMFLEVASENGNIIAVYHHENFVGYYIYAQADDYVEVRELFCLENELMAVVSTMECFFSGRKVKIIAEYNELLQKIVVEHYQGNFIVEPHIMGRIVNPITFMKQFQLKEEYQAEVVEFIVEIVDDNIQDNNKSIMVSMTKEHTNVIVYDEHYAEQCSEYDRDDNGYKKQVCIVPTVKMYINQMVAWLSGYKKLEAFEYDDHIFKMLNKIKVINEVFINDIV